MILLGAGLWIVAGILGFIAFVFGGAPLLSILFNGDDSLPHLKHRDKWLRQHFGEEGRRRWLENEKWAKRIGGMLPAFNRDEQVYKRHVKMMAKAQAAGIDTGLAHRTEDGGCSGLMLDPAILNRGVGKFCIDRPPWGYNHEKYSCLHNPYSYLQHYQIRVSDPAPWDTGRQKVLLTHNEPLGSDWMAAGFWDPVVRDDGEVVDPLALYIEDRYRKNDAVEYVRIPGRRICREVAEAIHAAIMAKKHR